MCNPRKINTTIIVVVGVVHVIKLTDIHQKKSNNVDSDKRIIQFKFYPILRLVSVH